MEEEMNSNTLNNIINAYMGSEYHFFEDAQATFKSNFAIVKDKKDGYFGFHNQDGYVDLVFSADTKTEAFSFVRGYRYHAPHIEILRDKYNLIICKMTTTIENLQKEVQELELYKAASEANLQSREKRRM